MKYIAFYDFPEYNYENRSAGVPARAVCKYMAEVLGRMDDVTVFSPIRTLNKKGVFKARSQKIFDRVYIKLPFSFGTCTPIGRAVVAFYTRMWLLFHLLFDTKAEELVVAYHSVSFIGVISFAKKIKHFILVQEIREIYADINEMSEAKKKKERRYFEKADYYIFATELLNQEINVNNIPYVIAPAVYQPEEIITNKYDDGKIHLIYAGTFRASKGGVDVAIKAARCLNDKYVLHICGTGSEDRIKEIQKLIEECKVNGCDIRYEGLLYGEEFKRQLQKCHIGLSTQNPDGAYNNSSFPSKIMTYLANGLDVVSIRIPAVETCPVGNLLHYYDENSSDAVADAIKKVNVENALDKTAILKKLDVELETQIREKFGV